MSLIYKTLFEVKLMHEYYLTKADGDSVFSLPNQDDRITFLFNQFTEDRSSINDDIAFKFPDPLEEMYSGYNLKLLNSYSGFKVAIRVNKQILQDGTWTFEPFISLPDNFNICVELVKRSSFADSYTCSAFSDFIQGQYVFSNENIVSPKLFPFITSNVSAFDASRTYIQGDVASYGLNDIRQYYKDNSGDQWEAIPGSAYANENDRLLLPLRFYYSFVNVTGITNADFTLKDKDGNTIKSISVSSADEITKTLLDFSSVSDSILLPDDFRFSEVMYTLNVSGSNGFLHSHNVLFSDKLYSRNNWGIAIIKTRATNAAFNLFENDGFIAKRRLPNGIWTEAPVFEIPVKSRFPYFRFLNDKGKELLVAASLTDYLDKEGKILLSKRPRSISKDFFKLQKEGSNATVYVPNPLNYDLKKDNKNRLCLDIIVPQSDLFPTAP